MMIAVVASDIGGYAVGVLFGKHPMVPTISPNKSWEGFAGSLVCGITATILTATLLAGTDVRGSGALLGILAGAHQHDSATWWSPRSSAISASRTWAGCCPATAA